MMLPGKLRLETCNIQGLQHNIQSSRIYNGQLKCGKGLGQQFEQPLISGCRLDQRILSVDVSSMTESGSSAKLLPNPARWPSTCTKLERRSWQARTWAAPTRRSQTKWKGEAMLREKMNCHSTNITATWMLPLLWSCWRTTEHHCQSHPSFVATGLVIVPTLEDCPRETTCLPLPSCMILSSQVVTLLQNLTQLGFRTGLQDHPRVVKIQGAAPGQHCIPNRHNMVADDFWDPDRLLKKLLDVVPVRDK